ncbi:histidine kinase [Sphingosinithalassobacter tenebrarum]|uniref:histidine kinase n=2 Tax=Stakelama tenebrarum TaxID=2711215 RepID=A0A6G6YAA0_9SPHN|nr:histidine kinase [Sphingosinithalassobacter tenebrarum]
MPTGAKVFLILSCALLPLALIALFTTLRTTRLADVEAEARLNAASRESTAVLESFLSNHVRVLRQALIVIERSPTDAPACTRLQGNFAALAASGAQFAITDQNGRILCGTQFSVAGAEFLEPGEVSAAIVPGEGLTMRIGGAAGGTASAYYPIRALAALARPSGFVPQYGAALTKRDGPRLELRRLESDTLEGRGVVRSNLGVDGLILEMKMPGAPITAPLLIAMLLPLLMWFAAAGIAWFVVDRLLIRPLRRLRAEVGAYQPGETMEAGKFGAMPAQEIRELGETFREISRTVQVHEADLAEGLVRQTRLTREVHHRVKNNLQVIASLINFHARGARGPEAAEAYASIQRRVDALAVVHRYHYAEMEENSGLELRSVIGELASSIRATAPASASGVGITLELEPYMVSQDVAVAVAFLLTEIVELAMNCSPAAQVRIVLRQGETEDRATLRVVSPALVESSEMEALLQARYGRVIGGLARQLRTKLHYDPLLGAYEMSIAVVGRS